MVKFKFGQNQIQFFSLFFSQVDMVDRRLRSTSLDHSVEMDEMMISNSNIRADDVLKPVSQIVTKIE